MKKFGRRKAAPEGWNEIEPTIKEFERKLREGKNLKFIQNKVLNLLFCPHLAENTSHEGKRIVESTWPIFQIHHQRSRYIYELFYKRSAISRELYEWCLEEGVADATLIAKWKRQGYENLCCLRCIQAKETNCGTQCICRVPKSQLEDPEKEIQCVHCGCRGCGGN